MIVFGAIITNIGGYFNPDSSSFLCPVTGVYYFSLTVANVDEQDNIFAHIMKDDESLVTPMATRFGTYNQGSASVVTVCERGQSVWAQNVIDSNAHMHGDPEYRYSTFSGFLIHVL